MNQRMRMLKEVAVYADNAFNSEAKRLGEIAAGAFDKKNQMKNLENIANSALKVSDVLNYIKRQTGRSESDRQWKKKQFGEELIKMIDGKIKNGGEKICEKLKASKKEIPTDKPKEEKQCEKSVEEERLEVILMLIREFFRQMVVHYEYQLSKNKEA